MHDDDSWWWFLKIYLIFCHMRESCCTWLCASLSCLLQVFYCDSSSVTPLVCVCHESPHVKTKQSRSVIEFVLILLSYWTQIYLAMIFFFFHIPCCAFRHYITILMKQDMHQDLIEWFSMQEDIPLLEHSGVDSGYRNARKRLAWHHKASGLVWSRHALLTQTGMCQITGCITSSSILISSLHTHTDILDTL